jgi:hypothetical protein
VQYERVEPQSHSDLVARLVSNDSEQIRSALYSAAWYEEDWRWTQENCLTYLRHPDALVRWAAALSLGYIAQFHKHLDLERVLPALHDAHSDPAISSTVGDALEMIAMNIRTQ